jgi:Asp-tRNA(Asn)/Glu-tRNA(Gln) amidotransferase C subunit
MATQNPKITISSLDETIEREMTTNEIAELEQTRTDSLIEKDRIEALLKDKELAKVAVLAKLGLTEEEAKALFG